MHALALLILIMKEINIYFKDLFMTMPMNLYTTLFIQKQSSEMMRKSLFSNWSEKFSFQVENLEINC